MPRLPFRRSAPVTDTRMVPVEEMSRTIQRITDQADATVELLQERFAELELALEDTGWMRQSLAGSREFSRDGLTKLIRIARLAYLKNPLIHNGVEVQANYVWGQGVSITAKAAPVNDVIQAFLDDHKNAQEMTGHAARLNKERQLQVESNLFFVLFTDQSTGYVRVRSINVDEITDIVKNPDDANDNWYYRRSWTIKDVDPEVGFVATRTEQAYYPDWKFEPNPRPDKYEGLPVNWDSPIYHLRTGGLADMTFGVPEIYSAMDWARAVKEDLEDYATIHRALSRFAMTLKVKGGQTAVAAAKTKLGTTLVIDGSQMETNPPPVTGSTFIGTDGADLAVINKTGATTSPDEGRRLWLMTGAGMGLPETMLSGDVSTGNLATAKSLDRPTELKMRNRQTLWADVYTDILNYVVDQAAIRVNGPLGGHLEVDPYSGDTKIVLNPDTDGQPMDRGIDINFPSVLEHDPAIRVKAIVDAATLGNTMGTVAGTIDPKTLSRLLLSALGVDDIDEKIDELFPDNMVIDQVGNPVPPPVPAEPGLAEATRELKEAIKRMTRGVAA